jgi:hypothetical protein
MLDLHRYSKAMWEKREHALKPDLFTSLLADPSTIAPSVPQNQPAVSSPVEAPIVVAQNQARQIRRRPPITSRSW